MGLFAAVWNPEPRASVTWGPLDDRWYTDDLGFAFDRDSAIGSGLVLSAESILRCGTVLAGVRFLADAWAMCPATAYRATDRGRVEDSGHYSQTLLRDPNAWQTDYRWQHMNMVRCAIWGNAHNEIRPARGSWAGELWPLDPGRVSIEDQRADGTLVYRYRPQKGEARQIPQERMLHFRGLSTDGVEGVKMYALIRNVVSIALAAEQHTAAFLRKGSRLSGLVTPTTPLEKEQRDALRASLNKDMGGASNTGSYGVLPFGVEVKTVASTNREGQLVELSDMQVGAILRFLGVPGVVAGYADKTATYASAKEFFESGGIKHCVLPWVTNFEAEVSKALLVRGDGRQIKYNLGVLLRSSTKETYAALMTAIGRPFMTGNEGRRIIDLNAVDGDPSMDQCVLPKNTGPDPEPAGGAPEPAAPPRRGRPAPATDYEDARSRGWQFALDASARVVRRELAALRDRAPMAARDPEGWREWLVGYYAHHVEHVVDVLHVEEAVARSYAEKQRDTILAEGLAVCESWHETIPYRLASLAYGD
jgi:HK97 family phage portal protein